MGNFGVVPLLHSVSGIFTFSTSPHSFSHAAINQSISPSDISTPLFTAQRDVSQCFFTLSHKISLPMHKVIMAYGGNRPTTRITTSTLNHTHHVSMPSLHIRRLSTPRINSADLFPKFSQSATPPPNLKFELPQTRKNPPSAVHCYDPASCYDLLTLHPCMIL
jgi:hypothetical protein